MDKLDSPKRIWQLTGVFRSEAIHRQQKSRVMALHAERSVKLIHALIRVRKVIGDYAQDIPRCAKSLEQLWFPESTGSDYLFVDEPSQGWFHGIDGFPDL